MHRKTAGQSAMPSPVRLACSARKGLRIVRPLRLRTPIRPSASMHCLAIRRLILTAIFISGVSTAVAYAEDKVWISDDCGTVVVVEPPPGLGLLYPGFIGAPNVPGKVRHFTFRQDGARVESDCAIVNRN